jgi:hypothetical protein
MEYRGIRNTISRRKVVQGAAAAVALGAPSIQAQQGQRLRFVAHADLKILDPVWTTAYIENPPVRLYSHDPGKSLLGLDCVVGLGGLEIPTKRLSATSSGVSRANNPKESFANTRRISMKGVRRVCRCQKIGNGDGNTAGSDIRMCG